MMRGIEHFGDLGICLQVGVVMYTFTDWHKTAWDKINVDTLGEEAKRLKNEIKTLNKAVSFCFTLLCMLPLSRCTACTLHSQACLRDNLLATCCCV
jgi:hypothetical protein